MQKRFFGTRDFYKKALWVALPVMGQNLIQTLVSLVDSFMVSGLGDVKMSGVNISGQVLFIFMVLGGTICSTGGIFMTQFFGAKNKRGMQQALCYKIIIAAFAIIVYMMVCMVIPRPVLSLMVVGNTQSEAILDVAVQYMFLMGFMGIPMMVSNIIASCLREIGEVRVPLYISVIATLINTFLNWVLIYGNLGAPRLEVTGAAYATLIARLVEMLMYIFYIRRNKQPFSISVHTLLHIDWSLFRSILNKGSMVFVSEMLWVVSETITAALYNSRGGADVVSGMASSFAIANLFFVAFSGINTATGIILGKSLGAGQLEEARQQERWLLSAALIFGFFMTLVGFGTCLLVPVVFGNLSQNAQEICRSMVFWMALYMPAWVYSNAQFSVSRAGGDTMMGMVVDGLCTAGLVIPGSFALALLTPVGPVTMYILVKAVDFIKITIAAIWLKKELWVKNLAQQHGPEAVA